MSKKSRIKILTILGFISMFILSINISLINTKIFLGPIKPRPSYTYYDVVINDLPGNLKNWAWASTQEWFDGGSGLPDDPYIIGSGHTFSASGSGNSFRIENSRKYFKILDCYFEDSGSDSAGLKLHNVSNAQIIDNSIYDNYNGIFISNCSNNVISDNFIYNNEMDGICSVGSASLISKNNTFTLNAIYQNNNSGINLVFSDFCYISGNSIAYNLEKGIKINSSHNTLISENGIYYNDYGISCIESLYSNMTYNRIRLNSWDGIIMLDCNNTNLYRNNINENHYYGITAGSCFNLNISGNFVEKNQEDGIIFNGGGNNTIFNNSACDNNRGIGVQFCNDNSIIGNNATNNEEYGIVLLSSSNNSILKNNLSYNYFGLYAFEYMPSYKCEDNEINNNILNNNFYGMTITSNLNNISGNTVNNNKQTGIQISGDNNNLSRNTLYNNSYYGISISNSLDNILIENNMRDCGLDVGSSYPGILSYTIDISNTVNNKPIYFYKEQDGLSPINFLDAGQIILIDCDNSIIKNVNVSNGSCGIYLYQCLNNSIKDINASYNSDFGVRLYSSHDSEIININASYNNVGIHLWTSNNNNVSINTVDNNERTGIFFYNCNDNNISGNNLSFNGQYGIEIGNSKNHNFTNNKMINCGLKIEGSSWDLTYFSSNNIDTSNKVNGKPLYFYVSQNNLGVNNFSNPGQIILIDCNDSIVSDFTISYSSIGVYLFHCKNDQIYHNNITYNNARGVMIEECYNISITHNVISNSGDHGIHLRDSDNNKILYCTITNVLDYGIYLDGFNRDNIIYYNTIDGGAFDDDIDSVWDDGYAGNYWADYTGDDLNQDGIGDSNYTITGNAKANDTRPLMYPVNVDTDGDGLINYEEYTLGKDNYRTNVTNPDSDYDGLSDYWEWLNLTNPWNPDTDYDNMPDLWEVLNSLNPLSGLDNLTDDDNDLLPNLYEFLNGTNPNINDTDGDTFLDGKEVELKTNPLNRWWYPMPNLRVINFSVSDVFEDQPFVLDFTVSNNGIWDAEGIIIIIRCESLGLTLYNNTDSPISLNVDESKHIIADCTKLSNPGVYALTLIIDPNNLINETYSSKDGSFNINGEDDNLEQIQMQILTVSGDGIVPFDYELLIWILVPIAVGSLIILGGILTKKKYEKIKIFRERELKAREDLNEFEQEFRIFIKKQLKEFYGDNWWKKGIPLYIQTIIEPKIKEKLIKKADKSLDGIDFLDFEHFFPIISEKRNWDNIFSNTFSIVNNITEPFENLKDFKNNLNQRKINLRDFAKYPTYIYAITKYFMREINVFLSYSTLDTSYFKISEIAKRLEKYPEINKILFWEVDSGEDVVDYMERSLKISKTFILFCSENSIKSHSVEDEWKAAFQLRKKGLIKIIPVYEDEKFIPVLLTPLLNVKFDKENFDEFIENLYKEILRS